MFSDVGIITVVGIVIEPLEDNKLEDEGILIDIGPNVLLITLLSVWVDESIVGKVTVCGGGGTIKSLIGVVLPCVIRHVGSTFNNTSGCTLTWLLIVTHGIWQ